MLALVTAVYSDVAASKSSTGRPTAAALYRALLTTSLRDPKLPAGFNSASINSATPSNNAKKHHAIGEVEFEIDNDHAFITYAVFPNRADAVDDYRDTRPAGRVISRLAAPGSLPRPAQILNGSVTGKNGLGKTVTQGVTGLEFVDESVVVAVITASSSNTDHGDEPGAIRLARLALDHLRLLRGR